MKHGSIMRHNLGHLILAVQTDSKFYELKMKVLAKSSYGLGRESIA